MSLKCAWCVRSPRSESKRRVAVSSCIIDEEVTSHAVTLDRTIVARPQPTNPQANIRLSTFIRQHFCEYAHTSASSPTAAGRRPGSKREGSISSSRSGVLAVRPFDQERLCGQNAVPPVAAAARLLSRGQGLLARRPDGQYREPWGHRAFAALTPGHYGEPGRVGLGREGGDDSWWGAIAGQRGRTEPTVCPDAAARRPRGGRPPSRSARGRRAVLVPRGRSETVLTP